MKINLPSSVSYIIEKLEEAGEEAYAVGGCVRDTVLGREPQDWDITTSAKPEKIKSLFRRSIDTGIVHGTVTVLIDHVGYEVTTYRIDGEYEDNRHPKKVEFTNKLSLDLKRRDFTINAMAYNENVGLVDLYNGMKDLENHMIRCVGNPGHRFDEDALRMLRAVRFSGQLGFAIDEETKYAILERVDHLENISAERIRVELTKLLIAKDARKLLEAYDLHMTNVFLPEFTPCMQSEDKTGEFCMQCITVLNSFYGHKHQTDVLVEIQPERKKIIYSLVKETNQKKHIMLCLSLLLQKIGEIQQIKEQKKDEMYDPAAVVSAKMAHKVLRRLTFDNDTVDTVKQLITWHTFQFSKVDLDIRKAVSRIGLTYIDLVLLMQYAICITKNNVDQEEQLCILDSVVRYVEIIREKGIPMEIKDLSVSGNDLMQHGVERGPEIGRILKEILEYVIMEPDKNDKELLLEKWSNPFAGKI